MSLFKSIIAVSVLAGAGSAGLWAQNTGSLTGQVVDPSGAAVPAVSVTVSGPNNTVKVATSGPDGSYSVIGLPPGQYTIRAGAPGFTLFEAMADLPAGRASTLNIKLTVAEEKQEVTVADTQQVELDPAKNAGALVLKETDLDILPDDPDDLQADLLALAGPAAGPNGGQIFVDGFSNGQLPPKESIREIRINSNPFSSEFDAPGYGRIEIFTKPGTDKLHAMVQMNYGDSIFNARNPYSETKPYYNTQNINANIGGALSKKASFFLDFARRYQKDSDLINALVVNPTNFAINTYNTSIIAPNSRLQISPRLDYQLSTNITLQARYTINKTEVDNQGVGGTNLFGIIDGINSSTAATNKQTNQNFQATETWVVNAKTINETRFQYQRQRSNTIGDNPELNISVNSAFTIGSNSPLNYINNDNLELQNYTSITHGSQFIKFGGRFREYLQSNYTENNYTGQFTFDSVNAYVALLQGMAQGLPVQQIIANGGGPAQYLVAQGQPLIRANQFDAGLFFQDDWRVKPSITLSLGARYEIQNNISDKGDWAPRIGLAWGIGPNQGRLQTPKTVLRAGYGWFYTRFPLADTVQADRFNGHTQTTYTVSDPLVFCEDNPSFCESPTANSMGLPIPVSNLPASAAATYHVDSNLRAPLMMQSAIGFDRQLPKNITLSMNYITTRGLHQLQTVDINTPLVINGIPTYVPATATAPAQGLYPYGAAAGIYDLYESSGLFKQSQLIFNTNARINSKITLFGYYVFGHANANFNGSPSNPYNFNADWGRSNFDIRHRVNINGTLVAPLGLRLAPNINYNSAPPFNITQGVDEFGDTLFNSRPAFEPAGFNGPACTTAIAQSGTACYITTAKYGNFVINPKPGMTVIPVNYGSAWGQFSVNMRLSRTWGFGEKATAPNNNPRQQQGGGPGGPGGPGGGGGFRGPGGGGARGGGGFPGGGRGVGNAASGQKYTLTAGLFVRNIFNRTNQGIPDSDLLSPRFGESLSLAGGGGATQSANRRIEFNLRFAF